MLSLSDRPPVRKLVLMVEDTKSSYAKNWGPRKDNGEWTESRSEAQEFGVREAARIVRLLRSRLAEKSRNRARPILINAIAAH